ncbi:MAG TPA: hypothetical protein VG937_34940 [Polyangiaceae bacterium]|nr:hypothetical protein [Polyangiaceae bacterium]
MPPLIDSDGAVTRALDGVPAAERPRVAAELAQVAKRALDAAVSPEQRRLAEALVLALASRGQEKP